jgi:hypothetical protein
MKECDAGLARYRLFESAWFLHPHSGTLQNLLSRHCLLDTKLHGAPSQKAVIFVVNDIGNSKLRIYETAQCSNFTHVSPVNTHGHVACDRKGRINPL